MSKTILCVDDSVTMQTVCEITFRASDYSYLGARSAEEGLSKARETKPALILADAAMPGKSGYDLCQEIKSDPGLAGVPVIVMCGNSSTYEDAKGSAAGVDGHVAKPWDTTKLMEQISGFLAKAETEGVASAGGAAAAAPAPTPPAPAPVPTPAPAMSTPKPMPKPAPVAAPKPAPPPVAARPAPTPPPRTAPAPAPAPQAAAAGVNRPPMIKGVPTKRPATPIPVAASAQAMKRPEPPRSATIMGMAPMQMPGPAPGSTPKPPGVTSISSKRPAQPPPSDVVAKVQSVMPAAAAAAAASAGLDPNGPEMAALVKLSRDVIEQVVWEVVPELAETIIRENLDRLATKH